MKKLICCLLITISTSVSAQSLELLVPYTPGGAADTVGRALQKFYQKQYQQSLTVINRPGAGGVIGTHQVLTRPADGNTLLLANAGSLLFNKIFYKNQPYDYSEFDIFGPYVQTPMALTVGNASVTSVNAFVELYHSNKKITCGTSSASGAVIGKYILNTLGLRSAEVIIYKGSPEVVAALIGKHIDCSFDNLSSQIQHHKNKNVNVIAVGSESTHPDVPEATLYKTIVPNLVFYYWYGIAVPKAVDPAKRKSIADKFKNAYKDQEFQSTMNSLGLESTKGHQNTQAWITDQYQKFNRMREELGIAQQ